MKDSIIKIGVSCFNASVNVCTRVVLLILSASVYQGFVIIEVLINNVDVWYPPMVSGFVAKIQTKTLLVNRYVLREIAIKVITL